MANLWCFKSVNVSINSTCYHLMVTVKECKLVSCIHSYGIHDGNELMGRCSGYRTAVEF